MRAGGLRCVAMVLLVGCYDPTFPENQPCSETQSCPGELACDVATNECVSELPGVAHFVRISAYDDNTCAIDPAGALFCWGHNERGELGLGDRDRRLVPTRVGSESDWLDVQTGQFTTCGLRAGDQLWCWGDDLETSTQNVNPKQVAGSYRAVSVGGNFLCAITTGQEVLCQRRNGAPVAQPLLPDIRAVKIAATEEAACVIDDLERLWCWGNNNNGQLGTGDLFSLLPEMAYQVPGTWSTVEIGNTATCAITTAGALTCWGFCGEGQVGRANECSTPGVIGDRAFIDVSVGSSHTCAIDTAGQMACLGANDEGELGARGGVRSFELLEVEHGAWTQVTAGTEYTCGLRADHQAWCWGTNEQGQLGDGGGGDVVKPVETDPGPFDAVFTGNATGCALKAGELWCWGANGFGQLGDGTRIERRRPVQIGTDTDWKTLSLSRTHTCGIREDSSLWCWGRNGDRELGIGGNLDALTPTRVGTELGWTEVAVTENASCAIREGLLYCWGRNRMAMPVQELDQPVQLLSASSGVFGVYDPALGRSLSFGPAQFLLEEEVQTWTALDRGENHVCGLVGSELWCFGQNSEGQLGRGFSTGSELVGRESTNGSWLKVSAGALTTCAISTDNTLACMGLADLNGLGERVTEATPVDTAKWLDVSVSNTTTCGIQLDGSLHCWGSGTASGRGDGKGGHERPTRVSPP